VSAVLDPSTHKGGDALAGGVISDRTAIAWLIVAAALTRLAVFVLTNNEPGDPDARAIDGAMVYASPSLIYSGIWLPLHRYAIALFMIPLGDPVLAGKTLSLLTGVAAVLPFYRLTRLYFDQRTALLAGGMFVIFGNHVGLSAVVMSEAPFVLLALWGTWIFAREMQSQAPRLRGFVFSAFLLALGGGLRQESWQLAGILMLWMLADRRTWRFIVPFAAIAFSPFVYWTIGNMIDGQGPLFGLLGVAGAKQAELAYTTRSPLENVVKWIWIFVQSPGPLISLLGAAGLLQAFLFRRWRWPLAVVAIAMLAPYVLLSIVKPEWAPQHRYVVLAVTLLLPYAAAAFWVMFGPSRFVVPAIALLLAASIGTQALAYSRHSSLYLPAKDYQWADRDVWGWLKSNLAPGDRLVIEDADWRAPGILLHSGGYRLPSTMVLGKPTPDQILAAIRTVNATLVVLHSPPSNWPAMKESDYDVVFRNPDYVVLRFKAVP
jgi:hypothetical protein